MEKKKAFKIGTRVAFTRRNGLRDTGRVAGTDDGINGTWVSVNSAPKGHNQQLTSLRPSQLMRL